MMQTCRLADSQTEEYALQARHKTKSCVNCFLIRAVSKSRENEGSSRSTKYGDQSKIENREGWPRPGHNMHAKMPCHARQKDGIANS